MTCSRENWPQFSDVESAAERIRAYAVVTPVLESELLNDELGGRLLIKPEVLQKTGSFKVRGAYNKIASLPSTQRARGVIAFSSGNHAQAVAAIARHFGIKATIVMPSDAPRSKLNGTRAFGASIVLYNRETEDREAIAARLAEREGSTLVVPYDEPEVIAGQGTVGHELVRQARDKDANLDAILAPCSGGGLVAGISIAAEALSPGTEVWAVEPERFDDTMRSLTAGRRVRNAPGQTSICDALLLPTPGELTFDINRNLLAGGVSVSEEQVKAAMLSALQRFKLVVEPGGAVALAAALANKIPIRDRTVGIVLSGGNVDAAVFSACLHQG